MIDVKVIKEAYQFDMMIKQLENAKILGVDTETTGLDPYSYHPLMISLYDSTTAFVVDLLKIDHKKIKQLKPILESPEIIKVGHNLSYEWKFFYHLGRIEMINMHDVMLVDRMNYAGLQMQHTLKAVVLRKLDIDMDKTIRASFIDADINNLTFSEEQYYYSAMDAVYPVQMYEIQMEEIKERKLERIYRLEMNIISPTAMMEYTGVYVNKSMIEQMIAPFTKFVRTADKALQDMLIGNGAANSIVFSREGYRTINTGSSDQVAQALERIGIVVKNSAGKLSLKAKIVQRWDMLQRKKKGKAYKDWDIDYHELIEDDEVADALDLYLGLDNPFLRAYTFLNGARKLLSTYIYGLLDAINPVTGKVHPYFNSLGAEATGRYSSNGPNFQNLPNDKKLKVLGLGEYSIRKALEAITGRVFIIADYSGIELVILAANSGDKKLMDMIIMGDIHTEVTIYVLGYKSITQDNRDDQPHKLWRDAAKTLSYGIAYGTTGRNISETLNIMLASVGYKIDAAEGDKLIAKWFELFPDVYAYLKSNADKAVLKGYVTDAWGRRRFWDMETFTNKWKLLAAQREGMNAPIQGTSATMTKLAIWLMWGRLKRNKARIIITIHDEIVVEAVESYAVEAAQIMKESMEQAIRETLPEVANVVGLYKGTSVSPKMSARYDK